MYNAVAPVLNLLSCTLVAQPLTHGVEYRPLDLNYNEQTEEELIQVTNGFNACSRSSMAHVAGKILAPTLDSKGTVLIENGWDEKRYSVNLIVEVIRGSHATREMLTGFTNYAGATASGLLDPEMTFMINDHTIISTDTVMGGAGLRSRANKIVTQKHINKTVVEVGHGDVVHATESLRPEDALAMASRASMIGDATDCDDSRTMISSIGNETSSLNALSSNWLHSLLTGVTKTLDGENLWVGSDHTIASQARNEVVGADNTRSMFMQNASNESYIGEKGVISVRELGRMFPNFDAATQVVDQGHVQDMRMGTEDMRCANRETLIADQLSNIIPAMLNRFTLSEINFCASNEIMVGLDGVGSAEVSPIAARAYRGAEDRMRINAESFCQNVKTEVIPVLFPYADCDFTINGTFRTASGSDLSISINGGHPIPFHAPNYADCLKGTMAALNNNQANAVASGVVKAIGSIKNNLTAVY